MSTGKPNKKKTIIIDRSKWRTGNNLHSSFNSTGYGNTKLLNEEGYKCCLGFIASQATHQKILNSCEPTYCKYIIPELSYRDKYGYVINSTLADNAIKINDNGYTTPQEKEKSLKQLFKDSRYKLVFKGKFIFSNRKK